MCGIAGAVFSAPQPIAAEDAVGRMTRALGHRGPDGSGLMGLAREDGRGAEVALGHTRLAILDLSDRAAQPMSDADRAHWITFNGEIFNFADLRAELGRAGHQFRTTSDTEVILAGYREWGDAVLDRLRGMFALAIWDTRAARLLLARDRLGIKPLYYIEQDGRCLFASEIRALLASSLVPKVIDPVAVDQYLAYQTTATPRTLVQGVRLLPAGTMLEVRPGSAGVARTYWDLIGHAAAGPAGISTAAAAADVAGLVEESVRLHLVSDVPVGVFLSGGVDSSALALFVKRVGVRPRTFCVSFPGTTHDEGPVAREIAEAIGADHHEVPVREQDCLDEVAQAVESFDSPSGDGINSYIVSRAVRSTGITVALSGLGGDELFGGYTSFARLRRASGWSRTWRHTPVAVRAAAARALRTWGPASVASEKAAAVLETDGTLAETFPVLRQVFSRSQRRQLLGARTAAEVSGAPDPYVTLLARDLARADHLSFQARVSYAEARTYMHDVLLRDTDQMSMCHGLEVRVPLLDHVLAEYVMGLPDAVWRDGRAPKALLLEAIGRDLPAACLARPKQGFVLPLDTWMRGALRPFCQRRLLGGALSASGMLHAPAIAALWTDFLDGRPSVTWSRLWTLVTLGSWLERTGVRL